MARSKQEITQALKVEFIGNPTVQEIYGLSKGMNFDTVFSTVSLEAILIHVVASSEWLLEQLWSAFSSEMELRINNSYVTSFSWYYRKALEFQKGVDLIFDEKTYSFRYPTMDESKQIVKYAAIRQVIDDEVTKLKVYFSDADKQPLTDDTRIAFESYMREIGAAGTHYLFVSEVPDVIQIQLHIWYDPLVLDSTGTRLNGGGKPVEETIEAYLNSLEYGGVFYSSKLVDRIQITEGVKDVTLDGTTWNGTTEQRRRIDSRSGAFTYVKDLKDITYSIE